MYKKNYAIKANTELIQSVIYSFCLHHNILQRRDVLSTHALVSVTDIVTNIRLKFVRKRSAPEICKTKQENDLNFVGKSFKKNYSIF